MKKIKSLLCLIGNYLPPRLNSYFYKLAGVKFNISKVWIGNKCYFDVPFPENITIKDNVCITTGVSIICHFDPSVGVKDHSIKKYKKKVLLEEGVFVGPRTIILPGVIIKKNTFIRAGTVVSKSTNENSLVYGNPQKEEKTLTKSLVSKINNQN
ncbi:hypothetical protein OAR15_00975, partial [Candidatus Pelagibacter sp.]|nr:hypothetical protein [Candidatus Pelagibacter sp.]